MKNKNKRPDSNSIISKTKLLRIYKAFLKEPNKVFVIKDFMDSYHKYDREKYFGTLIKLGLIEQVQAYWYSNEHQRKVRRAIGYKLKKNKQEQEEKWKIKKT